MRRHSHPKRLMWLSALLLFIGVAVWSCSNDIGTEPNGPPDQPPDDRPLVVTEPVALVAGAGAAFSGSSNLVVDVSYVSYLQGSVPEGDSIEVRNLSRSLLVGAPMIDGGVDPIPIPASVGDQLQIAIFGQGVALRVELRAVPDRNPPIVVRTFPPRRGPRVPLNIRVQVIFSEPVSPLTVTGQTIRLLVNGQPVPAAVSQSSDGLSAELVPSQPLMPGTTYSIAISTEVRDLAGDQLEREFTSDLTTLAAQLVGEIAFESSRNGRRWEIYLMKTDGSGISQLTDSVDGGGHAQGPSISPDGRQVAFSAWVEGGPGDFEIYTINVDGTGLRNLTQSPAFEGVRPSWSPDGSQLAFWGNRDDPLNEDIYVMNADGTGVTRLTTDPASDTDPAWSPDGTRIVFASDRSGNNDLYVMNADGSNPTQLTTDPDEDRWPAWSPDGSKIAFDRRVVGNHAEIYVMDADGTNLVRLTNEPGVDSGPGWSRDGTRIAFASDRDGVTAVWVMNADGTGLMKLTGDACCDFLPSWSP